MASVLIASVVFGALHSLTAVYFVYATVAGLVLGALANWHGTLWMPMAAHFSVDLVSLMILARWVRSQPEVFDVAMNGSDLLVWNNEARIDAGENDSE